MHRYQPRIHVVEAEDIFSMKWSNFQTFSFPETSFFAVTAYQNENVCILMPFYYEKKFFVYMQSGNVDIFKPSKNKSTRFSNVSVWYILNQERTISGIAETKKVINKWNTGDKPCIFIHSLSFLQITQLKIDNNPFAKGFRDREKVFPQKRSAPFMDQLREAASSEGKHRRSHSHESEGESSSPDKKDCITPPGTLDSIALYNSTKLDLLRQQIARDRKSVV